MSHPLELAGKQFKFVLALWPVGRTKRGNMLWACQCKCSRVFVVRGVDLKTGNTGSCGCTAKDRALVNGATMHSPDAIAKMRIAKTRHGHCVNGKDSPTRTSFRSAKYRCSSPRADSYARYGGRGIQFKFNRLEDLLADIGPRPKGKTIDRINNNGHYEAGNVRWSTPREQRLNQCQK